ncbi:hypothetical protein STAPHY8AQ_110018 [Staphylococcus sp. 8AQ]|nr:hypothetical protein STAPHY8AQ_110018 [Staphylococcus sp. 8AQ]
MIDNQTAEMEILKQRKKVYYKKYLSNTDNVLLCNLKIFFKNF